MEREKEDEKTPPKPCLYMKHMETFLNNVKCKTPT